MIDFLEQLDRNIVLAINGCNSPVLDEIMWWISARVTWIPLYMVLLYLAATSLTKKALGFFILFIVLTVSLTDLTSVHLFKNVFLRYRPSHNLLIYDQLHYYVKSSGEMYQGGKYGFVSSHAANYFSIITSVLLIFANRHPILRYLLPFFGVLICYSRIYLGVHYLSDLIAGAFLGAFVSLVLYHLYFKKHISIKM